MNISTLLLLNRPSSNETIKCCVFFCCSLEARWRQFAASGICFLISTVRTRLIRGWKQYGHMDRPDCSSLSFSICGLCFEDRKQIMILRRLSCNAWTERIGKCSDVYLLIFSIHPRNNLAGLSHMFCLYKSRLYWKASIWAINFYWGHRNPTNPLEFNSLFWNILWVRIIKSKDR